MKLIRLFALSVIVAVVSFLGFWVENIWLAITKGYMDNRNMRLPFLFGYGLAIAAIFLLFGTPQTLHFFSLPLLTGHPFLAVVCYYLLVGLCVALGEIALGTLVERVCGIVWWDYSALPFHITKYTSLPTTAAFALLITMFMGCVFTPLYEWLLELDGARLGAVGCILTALLTADFFVNAAEMYRRGEQVQRWRVDVSGNRLHKKWTARRV